MSKVRNESGRTVTILRWKVLPDGRVISPMGVVASDLPDDVVYSSQARHLADQNLITIEGYKLIVDEGKKVADLAPEPVIPDLPKVDDLTELANIGASRVKKLNAKSIFTFQNLVDYGTEKLGYLLQIEGVVAESIVNEAASKLGVGE
jgi:hypothetical protein